MVIMKYFKINDIPLPRNNKFNTNLFKIKCTFFRADIQIFVSKCIFP